MVTELSRSVQPATFKERAERNVARWGLQDYKTLGLAVAEEAGELAQAILQFIHEGGDEERIEEEAIDLGALCVQVLMRFDMPRLCLDPSPKTCVVCSQKDACPNVLEPGRLRDD